MELDIRCIGCGKTPDKISEYIDASRLEKITPKEYVAREEGTFNNRNGHFYCTMCYVKAGMPLGVAQ